MTFLEEFIAITEERHEEVLQLLDVGFWVWNPASEEVFWSDHLYQVFGLDRTQFEPSLEGYVALIHPEDRERVGRIIEEAVAETAPFRYQCRLQAQNGEETRWIEARGRPIDGADREVPKYLGTVQEVTGRVRIEERLRENERRLQEAQEVAQLGSWEWDPASGNVIWSDQLFELFGVDADSFEASFEAFADFVHPDEREGVLRKVQEAAEAGDRFDLEYRYEPVGAEGPRWLRSVGEPELDADGRVQRVVGIAQDVTTLKRAQRERAETRRYLEMLFELTPLALVVSTREGVVKEVNRSFEQDFGYQPGDVLGEAAQDLDIWVDSRDRDEILDELQKEDRVRRYPTRLRTASGEEREVELSVGELSRNGEAHLIWTVRDVTERNQYERRLEQQALYDAVTGLPNRNLLLDRLERALEWAGRSEKPLSVMFLDLDDFKAVNDQHGHAAGDELLNRVADRLRQTIRDGDTVARIAGDEFVLVLEEADTEEATATADRLLKSFDSPYQVAGESLSVSASVGIAVEDPSETEDLRTAEDLLRASDSAMYRVKKDGEKPYHVFGSEDRPRVHRLNRKQELRTAIAEDQLLLYYQPIVDLDTEEVRGAEALVRWEHPERGLVPPGEFIPFAEEHGLIARIDRWVLEEATRQSARWNETAHDIGRIRVNVAPHRDLDEGFQDDVLAQLERHDLPGEALEIEITERLALHEGDQFDRLRERGVRLAIDDFGTGYSSLFYLRKLDADALKIDPFFIQETDADERTEVIIEAVLEIAENFGMEVVAEGVETEEQRDRLRRMGCPLAQGYLFARPMPPDELEAFLTAS